MKLPLFKKADILLAALLLVLGAACFAFAGGKSSESGNVAIVTVDGETVGTYLLTEGSYGGRVDTLYGSNWFLVENNTIKLVDADCPGKDCTQFHAISSPGQVIVCVPHHMTVSITGGDEDIPDAVVR